MPPERNVLFITVDQWRGDFVSALGHPVVVRPTLDALASRGVLLANHWANDAPCGPSRACLYTGTYQHRNRSLLNGTPLDARFTNVALLAREVGYEPVLFGYTDTSVDPRTVPPGDPRPPRRNPLGYHDLYSADAVGPFTGCPTPDEEAAIHPLAASALGVAGVGA